MTTARQIVDGAAEEISVKTAEIPLQAFAAQSIFARMNDMLTEWSDAGLTPAFKEVFNLDDAIDVDRNAVGAIKFSLAIRCAPSFQKTVTQALALSASDSLSKLEASVAFIGKVAFPDTLPIGSGNECANHYADEDRFFDENKPENF